jgi:hypothetical protein
MRHEHANWRRQPEHSGAAGYFVPALLLLELPPPAQHHKMATPQQQAPSFLRLHSPLEQFALYDVTSIWSSRTRAFIPVKVNTSRVLPPAAHSRLYSSADLRHISPFSQEDPFQWYDAG